jgi:VanZ family protein
VLFSSGPSASSSWTKELLRRLFGLSGEALDVTNLVVRKAGHVGYYFVLALALAACIRAWSGSVDRRQLWLAVALALGTAVFDEIRQSLFAGRTGTPLDLIYDGIGVGLAVWILARGGTYSSSAKH